MGVVLGSMIVWVAALSEPAATPPEPAPAFVSYYFDEPRTLTLDPTRVAVFATGVRDVRGADLGLDGARVEFLPLLSAQLVELPEAERSWEGVRGALDEAHAIRAESVGYVSPVFVGEDGGPLVPTPTILVRFADGVDAAACEADLSKIGEIVERGWAGMPNAYRVASGALDGRDVLEQAAELARRDDTLFAEADMLFTGTRSMTPNDPLFLSSWGLNNIGQSVGGTGMIDNDVNAVEAWDTTIGDPGILTLVLDQGVQTDHPDINQFGGQDFTSDGGADGGPQNDCDDHGTAVAGCISGVINNALGSCGVAPGTRIVSARVHISDIPCTGEWFSVSSWTVNALAYGETLGVRVTNNSNRYGFTASAIANKYGLTRNGTGGADPMVHFAAAGNDGQSTVDYPASLASVNAISAVDIRGLLVSFSNRGPSLFMCGPGRDVRTTDRTGFDGYSSTDYGLFDGTSFSSPIVAGVAALVLSQNPSLSSTEVEDILRTTAKDMGDPGFDESFGWGMPDAEAALAAAGFDCPADCDGNLTLNLDDLDCFVAGFLGGDAAIADCDGNGSLNLDDVDCFVASFLAGCS
ncbi:MAG: S8 family serine peptidase [Phycisphaerales bacterium]